MSSLEETKVKELLVADRDLQGLRRLRELGLLLPPVLPSTAATSSTTIGTSTSSMIFPPEESLASFWTVTTTTTTTATSDLEDARVQLDEQGRVAYLNLCGKRLHRGLDSSSSSDSVFSHFSVLRTLNLGGTDLPRHDTVRVLAAVSSTLTTLHLSGNGLGDEGAALLAASWMQRAGGGVALVKLDLRFNDITGQGMTALCQSGFPHCSKLTILHLEGNQVGDDGCGALAQWMLLQQQHQPPPPQQLLDDNDNHETTTATAVASEVIDPSPPSFLEQLYLGANLIGPAGAVALAAVLRSKNSRLTKLFLEGNRLGPEGATALALALEQVQGDSPLKNLYVDNNSIGKEGSQRLARALNSATVIPDGMED